MRLKAKQQETQIKSPLNAHVPGTRKQLWVLLKFGSPETGHEIFAWLGKFKCVEW